MCQCPWSICLGLLFCPQRHLGPCLLCDLVARTCNAKFRPKLRESQKQKTSEHDSHRKVPAFFPWSFCFSIWALVSWLASNTLTKSTAWYWRLQMELLILAEMLILHDVAAFRLTTLLYFTQFDSISIIWCSTKSLSPSLALSPPRSMDFEWTLKQEFEYSENRFQHRNRIQGTFSLAMLVSSSFISYNVNLQPSGIWPWKEGEKEQNIQ